MQTFLLEIYITKSFLADYDGRRDHGVSGDEGGHKVCEDGSEIPKKMLKLLEHSGRFFNRYLVFKRHAILSDGRENVMIMLAAVGDCR